MNEIFKKEGINKRERIRKKSQFIRIFKNSKRIETKKLRIYFEKNKSNISKFTVVTGKKVGNAVIRNRIKRIIKEVYRKNKEFFGTGTNWIFIPQGKWEKIDYSEAERLILNVIEGIKKKRIYKI